MKWLQRIWQIFVTTLRDEIAEAKRCEPLILKLQSRLADCYRATGAASAGYDDWELAEFAVLEVRRLRKECDVLKEKLEQSRERTNGILIAVQDAVDWLGGVIREYREARQ